MFLICTADEAFWPEHGPVLFLGEWCKVWGRRERWGAMTHQVLPYHWSDPQAAYADYLVVDDLYEQCLGKIARALNDAHGIERSVRYWRIVVGPWLQMFIAIVWDRWRSVLTAEESGLVTDSVVGEYEPGAYTLRDNLEFGTLYETDSYNQFLFSSLIVAGGRMPFRAIPVSGGRQAQRTWWTSPSAFKGVLRRVAERLSRSVPSRLNRVVLVSTSLANRDLFRLQLALGQLPYVQPPMLPASDSAFDPSRRAALKIDIGADRFARVLSTLISDQLPSVYFEGYERMRDDALRAYPANPRVMFTSYAYDVDEAFKFWAAENMERGAKLVGTQHGFNYGITRWFQEEDHQVRIYDRFYTWGWDSKKLANAVPLAAAKFNRARAVVKPTPKGRVLLTTYAWPRYMYKLYAVPQSAAGMLQYFDEQFRFAGALSEQARRLLLVRACPSDRGWHQVERWAVAWPDVECHPGRGIRMFEHMCQSRLMVTTINGTPAIEALASNYPCILQWHSVCEIRPDAQSFYDELREADILHATPEDAAAKVDEILADPLAWWLTPRVQRAKDRFTRRFARTSETWRAEWVRELSTQAARAQPRVIRSPEREALYGDF